MPNPGDGFTVMSAMRHSQPNALTLLVSGYPDVQSAMAAILLEADEIIVKPFEARRLVELLQEKISTRRPTARRTRKEWLQSCSMVPTMSSRTGWQRSKRAKNSATFLLATKSARDIFRS